MKIAATLTASMVLTGGLFADPAISRKTLLLDATLIQSSHNIRIAVGQARKFPGNPLFGEEHPWEARFDNMYPNVIWDESDQLYKCWYNPFLVEVEDWLTSTPTRQRWLYPKQSGLCYAYSKDGLNWVKPKFNILPFRGQLSNILMRDAHGVGVFRDSRETNPARRYKSFFVNEDAGRRTTVAVSFSANGINWGPQTLVTNAKLMADTHNNALWAPTLNRYVAFTRDWDRNVPGEIKAVRLVARIESQDFEHWSDPQVVLRGLDPAHQVYAMPVFYYAGIYIGLPVIFDISSDRTHAELAWSKDTVTWHRADVGTYLIPNSEKEGDFDFGCIYPAAVPLIQEDGIKLYYAGSNAPHWAKRKAWLALAVLRPDGFAAATPVDADRNGGIITVPVRLQAMDELRVTADVEAEGRLHVALLDDEGREVAQSTPLSGSFSARPVEWQGPRPPLKGNVRLSFTLFRARLYSYEVVASHIP